MPDGRRAAALPRTERRRRRAAAEPRPAALRRDFRDPSDCSRRTRTASLPCRSETEGEAKPCRKNSVRRLASPHTFRAPRGAGFYAPFRRWSGFLLLSLRRDLEERRGAVHDRAFRHLDLFDVFARRQVEHDLGEQLLEDCPQASRAGAALERLLGYGAERRILERELHFLELEELGVLLGQRVLGFLEDADQCILVERFESDRDRKTADELWYETEAEQVVGLDLGERIL